MCAEYRNGIFFIHSSANERARIQFAYRRTVYNVRLRFIVELCRNALRLRVWSIHIHRYYTLVQTTNPAIRFQTLLLTVRFYSNL